MIHAPRDRFFYVSSLDGSNSKPIFYQLTRRLPRVTSLDGIFNHWNDDHTHMGDSKPGRKPRVTDEEILAVFEETDDPVLSTAEVAEALPLQRRSVYNRLVQLEETGRLTRKQIGGRNTIWWLTD